MLVDHLYIFFGEMLVIGFYINHPFQAVDSMIVEDTLSSLGLQCKGQPLVMANIPEKNLLF